jgi:hypothetical protein
MQGANKRTGRLPKKPEPAADEAATDELATDEPATESTTLESTDDPAIIEPNTMEPLGTSREDTGRQGTDEVMVRSHGYLIRMFTCADIMFMGRNLRRRLPFEPRSSLNSQISRGF